MTFVIHAHDPGNLASHRPDAHYQLVGEAGIAGHCSLWWNALPRYREHRIGMIGHYAAAGDRASVLLEHSCRVLARQDCSLAVGPMDGSTWRSYRLITQFGDEPRFFLEPDNPRESVDQFVLAGFEPLAHYFSAVEADLDTAIDGLEPRIARCAERLAAAGVVIRPMRESASAMEDDLRRVLELARVAFSGNLLYSDPEEPEFLQACGKLRGRVPLDLVLLAEQAGQLVGFLFAVPDLSEPERGAPMRTVIFKTLAVRPGIGHGGLGQVLMAVLRKTARRLGYSRAIHALVRSESHLRRISGRYARPFREYTLFAKVLTR